MPPAACSLRWRARPPPDGGPEKSRYDGVAPSDFLATNSPRLRRFTKFSATSSSSSTRMPQSFSMKETRRIKLRELMRSFVDTARERIDQLVAIPNVNKIAKGKRLLPKHVDHVFQVVGPFFDEALISVERVRLVAALALEISDHVGDGKLRFPHRG